MAVRGSVAIGGDRDPRSVGARSRLVDVALAVAAALGLACVVATVLAGVLHLSLVMFSTGSMAPTMPTGTLALVQRIPASQARVGDVVTVDRVGMLPITHRIVSVSRTSGPVGTRVLVLKGDANRTDDPAPYVVSTVRIVRWSAPGWAYPVAWASNPIVVGTVTVGAAGLVTWAFWPRRPRRPSRHRAAAGSGAALVVLLAVGGVAVGSDPARAATPAVVQGRHLLLTSTLDEEQAESLAPGQSVVWTVVVQTLDAPPEPTHVGLALDSAAADASGLRVRVDGCEEWAGGGCAVAASEWVAPTTVAGATSPVAQYGARELATVDGPSLFAVLVTVSRDEAGAIGDSASLRLQFWADDDAASASVGPHALASTGAGDGTVGAADVAVGAVLLGLAVAVGARVLRSRSMRTPQDR